MKAHSKSEMKRLYAMGIEVDEHLDWCSADELGVCSCGVFIPPDVHTVASPASEASAEAHIQAMKLLRKAREEINDALDLLGEK